MHASITKQSPRIGVIPFMHFWSWPANGSNGSHGSSNKRFLYLNLLGDTGPQAAFNDREPQTVSRARVMTWFPRMSSSSAKHNMQWNHNGDGGIGSANRYA